MCSEREVWAQQLSVSALVISIAAFSQHEWLKDLTGSFAETSKILGRVVKIVFPGTLRPYKNLGIAHLCFIL